MLTAVDVQVELLMQFDLESLRLLGQLFSVQQVLDKLGRKQMHLMHACQTSGVDGLELQGGPSIRMESYQ